MELQRRFGEVHAVAKPRKIRMSDKRPIRTFVVKAEEELASTGAVGIDPSNGSNRRQFFGYDGLAAMVKQWKKVVGGRKSSTRSNNAQR
jgi:hypothetical protein